MSNLTESQSKIVEQLVAEFSKINETPATNVGSLINISKIKEDVFERNKFIAECEAENKAFERRVAKQVREDADKLREDLNEIGLDAYHGDEDDVSSIRIVKKGDCNKSIGLISYRLHAHIKKQKLGKEIWVNQTFQLGYKNFSTYTTSYSNTIEELVILPEFTDSLERFYNFNKDN